jgi:predicted metal-dependent hydrolase
MVRLLEPTHSPRFVALMDRLMPKWRFYRDKLNRLPLKYEDWGSVSPQIKTVDATNQPVPVRP